MKWGSGTGSGVLINENSILTCAHNITDLFEIKCFIGEDQLEIKSSKTHSKHDIGILRLNNPISIRSNPYFGVPNVLESTITLGYPPLRGIREAALISQKGEINSISYDWNNCECITISSTVARVIVEDRLFQWRGMLLRLFPVTKVNQP